VLELAAPRGRPAAEIVSLVEAELACARSLISENDVEARTSCGRPPRISCSGMAPNVRHEERPQAGEARLWTSPRWKG
jgi:hypothetical protein